ncbi:MAG TPA: response regulator [Candidatus Kapabacteria bacterium]|nr:response regulator [Candidatus Kapabacteria bacterium]HOV91917.1 response regulator [Candidatus Kapabacteria bacterium]
MSNPLILVVDDNKITTKLMHRYLSAHNFEVIEAFDGIECLEKIKETPPNVVVLDVMMPRMDGYETVKQMRDDEVMKNIPVVIVTALNDVQTQIKAIEMGADDFLSKPVEEKLLIAKAKLLSELSLLRTRVIELTSILNKLKENPNLISNVENIIQKDEFYD